MCNKPGCWSTRHTTDERQQVYTKFRDHTEYILRRISIIAYFQAYLTQVEGVEGMADDDNNNNKTETSPPALEWLDIKDDDDKNKTYFSIHFGEVSGIETVAILNDQSIIHAVTYIDAFRTSQDCLEKSSIFIFEDRYSVITF